jgi:hypothetical protein
MNDMSRIGLPQPSEYWEGARRLGVGAISGGIMDGQTTTMTLTAFERLARSRQRAEQLAQVCRTIEADVRQLGLRPAPLWSQETVLQTLDGLDRE